MSNSPDRQDARSHRDPPSAGNNPETPANLYRQLRSEMLLRTAITFFATLAGIACYYVAGAVGMTQTISAIAGLVFALLVCIAARSLTRDFLQRAGRGRADRDGR
jgi:hypothetical protein